MRSISSLQFQRFGRQLPQLGLQFDPTPGIGFEGLNAPGEFPASHFDVASRAPPEEINDLGWCGFEHWIRPSPDRL